MNHDLNENQTYQKGRTCLALLALDVVEGRREHRNTRTQTPQRMMLASQRSYEVGMSDEYKLEVS